MTRLALIGLAALAAHVTRADEAPPAAWPPVVFTVDLVDALDAEDELEWRATTLPDTGAELRTHLSALIRAELALKYPCGFLESDLLEVHVVRELRGGGRAWGGLHWNRRVILTAGPDNYVVAALHHEIAGLLIEQHPGARSWYGWDRISQPHSHAPGEFSFLREAGDDAAEARIPRKWRMAGELSDELAEVGFVSPYGLTTRDNDMEEYLRLLLQKPGQTLRCARRHAFVHAKLQIALTFLDDASAGAMSREFLAGWMSGCGDAEIERDPTLLAVLGR